jgi:RNA polymerase sigma factor (sigma-70 family)
MECRVSQAVRRFRTEVLLSEWAAVTDGQLLERFVAAREAAAMDVLVRRHAQMVWGVCRRLVPHQQDAEDAFQATWIVLVEKAASVAPPEMVANFLFGVARQTALKARATAAKRRARERQVSEMAQAAKPGQAHDGSSPLLEEELARLPAAQRVVVLLCDLEGKTRQEAARQLGVPEGTVASRLARARQSLARRLARRGAAPGGGSLAAVLSPGASGAVPAELLSTTLDATASLAAGNAVAAVASAPVASLTQGVLQVMSMTKLKAASAVMAVMLAVALGGGLLLHQATAQQQSKQGKDDRAPKKGPDLVKQDRKRLEGKWKLVSIEVGGQKASKQEVADAALAMAVAVRQDQGLRPPRGDVGGLLVVFDGAGKWKHQTGDGMLLAEGTSKIDPTKKLRTIDETGSKVSPRKETTRLGIYELVDDDTLRLCRAEPGGKRPTAFATGRDDNHRIWVLERVKEKKEK